MSIAIPVTKWELDKGSDEFVGLLFTDLATIERPARNPDGRGGRTISYQVIGSNVPCLIQEADRKPEDVISGDGQKTETSWYLMLPKQYYVQPTDRISVKSTIYEVVSPDDDNDVFFVTALCRRIDYSSARIIAVGAVSMSLNMAAPSLLVGIYLYPSTVNLGFSVKPANLIGG
jgi:hypothetical protein